MIVVESTSVGNWPLVTTDVCQPRQGYRIFTATDTPYSSGFKAGAQQPLWNSGSSVVLGMYDETDQVR